MIQYDELNRRIAESGLTKTFISGQMGLSTNGLRKKLDGRSSFTIDETTTLCNVLHFSKSELLRIFFAQ